jgi:hypothetical protein
MKDLRRGYHRSVAINDRIGRAPRLALHAGASEHGRVGLSDGERGEIFIFRLFMVTPDRR